MSVLFATAVAELVERFGPTPVRSLADRLEEQAPEQALLTASSLPGFPAAVGVVLEAQQLEALNRVSAAAYLRGVAAGYELRSAQVQVETVWSGPSSHSVPVRASAQVLIEVVGEAQTELVLMTYSARSYPPLAAALSAAVARGVAVAVVVETLAGAGSALNGSEPAMAFAGIPGVQLWHWPADRRTERGAKMHAKVAVADRRVLLVTSANLTQSGVGKNLEAGLLVRGHTPSRVAEHIDELRSTGVLTRLRSGPDGGGS